MLLPAFKLNEEDLRKKGVSLSNIRTELLNQALLIENKTLSEVNYDLSLIVRLSKKAHKQFYGVTQSLKRIKVDDFDEETPIDKRRYSKKRARLTTSEQLNIAHAALVDFKKQTDIAKEFRVRPQCVSKIVCKARKNPKIFEELQ